jgi:hypothetical protein
MSNNILFSQNAGRKKFTYSLFVTSGTFTLSSAMIFGFVIAKGLDPRFLYFTGGFLLIAMIISIVGICIKPYDKSVAEVAQDQMKVIARMNRGPESGIYDRIDDLYNKMKEDEEDEEEDEHGLANKR